MKILISGAGIAGPTLAYWLAHYGFETTIVEKSPRLRTGGYVIDFWGAGYDVAERMGLLPEIREKGYLVRELRIVNRNGKRVSGFSTDVIADVARGRFTSLPRGDLAATIFGTIADRVETIFGDSITGIEQTDKNVRVTFEHAAPRDFDLVVGADGLHSRVRELVFGPERRFEHYLGYKVAAFEAEGYRPRDELVYVMYTEVGQQAARFAMRGDRTMFLFVFTDEALDDVESDVHAQKTLLRKRFGNSGWECPQILDALDAAGDIYFDRVSQIRMNTADGGSTRGRVTLLGDAASCVSLLAGQGSALAMVAAYILAGELHRTPGDFAGALERYQKLFTPLVAEKQKAALRFAGTFAPRSKVALLLRNQMMKLMTIPWVASLMFTRDLVDKIELQDYE